MLVGCRLPAGPTQRSLARPRSPLAVQGALALRAFFKGDGETQAVAAVAKAAPAAVKKAAAPAPVKKAAPAPVKAAPAPAKAAPAPAKAAAKPAAAAKVRTGAA